MKRYRVYVTDEITHATVIDLESVDAQIVMQAVDAALNDELRDKLNIQILPAENDSTISTQEPIPF